MNNIDKENFRLVSENRRKTFAILNTPAFKGLMENVINQYSDPAHFIYELLQNADDVKATDVWMQLEEDRLLFSHNGKKHFNITALENEEADSKNKRLGDINSICSVGDSTKKDEPNKIGKFGIGFKACFQYTSSPLIYDKDVQFKIKNYFVPELIEDDRSIRKEENYTYFIFPFNSSVKTPELAHDEISQKLESLVFPNLFLNNLKTIFCEYDGNTIIYSKTIIKQKEFEDNTIGKLISLEKSTNTNDTKEKLWLFERKLDDNLNYAVGYLLDENGDIKKTDYDAFSYFLTKEKTNLSYIIQAPFKLTAGRETITAQDKHNIEMIDKLSDLAADSLIYLRDIGINQKHLLITDNTYNEIIPFDSTCFENNTNRLSFNPFYLKTKNKIKNTELLPSSYGYVCKDDAYWAYEPSICTMFEDDLKVVTKNKNSEWILRSTGYQTKKTNQGLKGKYFYSYITEILDNNQEHLIETEKILKSDVFGEVIESHDIKWIKNLYDFIESKKNSVKSYIKHSKIFIDSNNKACSCVDNNNQPILFLPSKDIDDSEYRIINRNLLSDKEIRNFITSFDIKEPSKLDHIYNVILKKSRNGKNISKKDFNYIYNFSNGCQSSDERDDLLEVLKNERFISYTRNNVIEKEPELPEEVYLPSDELIEYFKEEPSVPFVLNDWIDFNDKENRIHFLKEIGCRDVPKVIEERLTQEEANELDHKYKINFPLHKHNTAEPIFRMDCVDGLKSVISRIIKDKNFKLSVLLWNVLVKSIEEDEYYSIKNISAAYKYRAEKYRKTDDYYGFDPEDKYIILNEKWIFKKDGEMVSPKGINVDDLVLDYNLHSDAAKELISFLEMEDSRYANLSIEDREKIEFGNQVDKMGFSRNEILEILTKASQRKNRSINNEYVLNMEEETKVDTNIAKEQKINEIYKSIEDNRQKIKNDNKEEIIVEETFDEDDYTKQAVDYQKKIERKKEQFAQEIDKINEVDQQQKIAMDSDKYSYLWFKSLLNLEMHARGDENSQKTVYVKFGSVRKEEGTDKTIILEKPFGKISPDLEELSDIPLTLEFEGKVKNLFIEALSVQSYVVRAKLRSSEELNGVKLEEATLARLEIKNPIFLLKELRDRYYELGLNNKDNLKSNLPKNIEFIFGPPGTGKTTYLAKNVLIPLMMNGNEKANILVLTPTNKAADVIVNRICDEMPDDSYKEWLIRFGLTFDQKIESSYLYKDKHVNVKSYRKSITVTTIQRYSYDFFIPGNQENYNIRDVDWDYIVVDEASMISLGYIIYPLYKSHPKKFIIAGDPFQIEPIVYVDLWKNENIYTMVELDSFSKPKTRPNNYKVTTLTTQYRSIPVIGNVFGNLTYGGVLSHNRKKEDKRHINFGDDFNFASINLIQYPVSKYESIYSSKYLKSSSYHIYSALFAYEFIKYLVKNISINNEGEIISIGLISPYRAQADIINKLLSNISTPKNISIEAGTIHSFQGDECDIIIDMFNTPANKLGGKNLFINKLNIINVALSRARDYLFVIMPDENTEGIENLTVINKAKKIFKSSRDYTEINAKEIEKVIFENENYFEENSFITGHQSVNIYSTPEKKYEIRSEDEAVDIQIHKKDTAEHGEPTPNIDVKEKTSKSTKVIRELFHKLDLELDKERFDIKMKNEEGKISILYLGSTMLDVYDLENGSFSILTKGRYLSSISLEKEYEIIYHPKDIVKFELVVSYNKIDDIIESFTDIDEVFKIKDDDAYETLEKLNYNIKTI